MKRALIVVVTIALIGAFALGGSPQTKAQPTTSATSRSKIDLSDSVSPVVGRANAIGIDTSKSMVRYLPEVRSDVAALVDALGSSGTVSLVSIDSSAHTLFEHELDAPSRKSLIETVKRLVAAGQQTDLGNGLESIRILRSHGRTRIFLFTDGNPKVARGSKFYNRSFEQLLNDRILVPDDVEVFVRIYGTSALKLQRPNVRVFRSAPNWKSALSEGSENLDTNSQPPAPAAGISSKWLMGGIVTAMVTVLSLILIVRMRRVESARKAAAQAEAKMRLPVEIVDEEQPPEVPAPVFRPRVVVEADGTTRSAALDQEHREVKIGDSWDADLFIDDCAGCAAVLRVSGSENQSRLPVSLENRGNSSLSIGSLQVEPGRSQALPFGYVEIRLGNTVFHKFDQLVEVTSSE